MARTYAGKNRVRLREMASVALYQFERYGSEHARARVGTLKWAIAFIDELAEQLTEEQWTLLLRRVEKRSVRVRRLTPHVAKRDREFVELPR